MKGPIKAMRAGLPRWKLCMSLKNEVFINLSLLPPSRPGTTYTHTLPEIFCFPYTTQLGKIATSALQSHRGTEHWLTYGTTLGTAIIKYFKSQNDKIK